MKHTCTNHEIHRQLPRIDKVPFILRRKGCPDVVQPALQDEDLFLHLITKDSK